MRASIFVNIEQVKIRKNGNDDLRFICIDVDECTIFFEGYGSEHADQVQRMGEGLIKAAMELHSLIALDKEKAKHDAEMERLTEPVEVDEFGSSLDQHDTREEHKGEV